MSGTPKKSSLKKINSVPTASGNNTEEPKATSSSPAVMMSSDSEDSTKNQMQTQASQRHSSGYRVRAASTSALSTKSEKTGITQTSSLDDQRLPGNRTGSAVSGSVYMSTGSHHSSQAPPPQLLPPYPLVRTYSGRQQHRNSGLFSRDHASIDLSVNGSKEQLFLKPGERIGNGNEVSTGEGGGGADGSEKRHTVSIAGSVGSASSDRYGADELSMKERYRPFRRRWRRFRRKYKGCIFAFISSFSSSLAQYFAHKLTFEKHYDAPYCLLWRYFGVLFPGIFIVLYYRFCQKDMVFDTMWPLKGKEHLIRFGLSTARGLLDVLAAFLNYQAFRFLYQSETSTILNSKPIIVQLLAHYTLGEPWGIVPIVMSVFVGVGVLVISKPPFITSEVTEKEDSRDFETVRLPGAMYAIGSMLLASIVYVILRYLKDVHYSVFSLFIGVAGVIFAMGMTLGSGNSALPENNEDLWLSLGLAGLVLVSSIAIVIALQNEEAFVVSLVRSFDVIFSFIWEMCFGTYPDWYRGGGAMIIMFSVMIIFFRKYLTHQDPSSKVYRRFHFLTK